MNKPPAIKVEPYCPPDYTPIIWPITPVPWWRRLLRFIPQRSLKMTVRDVGDKFQLISSTGKVLGTHDTRIQAEAQEKAIQISKARAKGKRIPKKK